MKYLGIDYGTKRVGVATSDDSGSMAFPYRIVENNKNLLNELKKICTEEKVETIIVGESVDYKGQPNIVKKEIDKFIVNFSKEVELPIVEEREFLTTQQARFFQEDKKRVDDSAAALILQSYLDRKNNKPMMDTLDEIEN